MHKTASEDEMSGQTAISDSMIHMLGHDENIILILTFPTCHEQRRKKEASLDGSQLESKIER